MRYSLFFCPTFYFFPTTCFVQNSRIHAKNFRNSRITQVFLEIHANPIFREIGEIFGKNRENCQKSGKFAQVWVKRENSRVHAKSRVDSRIHAIEKWIFTFTQVFSIHAFTQFFFDFHAFTQPKKPVHAFTQTAEGAPFIVWFHCMISRKFYQNQKGKSMP